MDRLLILEIFPGDEEKQLVLPDNCRFMTAVIRDGKNVGEVDVKSMHDKISKQMGGAAYLSSGEGEYGVVCGKRGEYVRSEKDRRFMQPSNERREYFANLRSKIDFSNNQEFIDYMLENRNMIAEKNESKANFDIGLAPNDYWKFSVDRIGKYFSLDEDGNLEPGATMAFNNINLPALDGVVRIFLDQERPRRTDEEFEKFIKFASKFNRLIIM